MEFKEKLKAARKAAGMTQEGLAIALDVHRSTVANYEIGRRKPDINELKRIAETLHVDLNYLMEGQEVDATNELLTRAGDVFSDLRITEEDKDAIFRDIMQLYMEGNGTSAKRKTSKRS